MAVKLSELIRGIDLSLKALWVYLNRETGEIHVLLPEHFDAADRLDLLPIGVNPDVRKAKEILTDAVYIRVPTRIEVNEYRMMRLFADSVGNPKKEEELKRSLQSGLVDGRWDNLILGLGLTEDWTLFRKQLLRRVALNWGQLNNIAIEEG